MTFTKRDFSNMRRDDHKAVSQCDVDLVIDIVEE